MAFPGNKRDLRQAIILNYNELTNELSGIPAEQVLTKELAGHV